MSIAEVFNTLPDPRAANSRHKLGDLVVILIAAVLCGRKTATDIALFADINRERLRGVVDYNTPPSHDTISRLLRFLDREAFAAVLPRFASAFAKAGMAKRNGGVKGHVAIDGKALRRAFDDGGKSTPPMTVSAFASATGLTLAALSGPADGGTDEGKIAIEVVKLLDLTGKIITGDALHCNRAMAHALTDKGADYALALKRNRAAWCDEAESIFAKTSFKTVICERRSHGRNERREAAVVKAPTPCAPGHKAYGKIVAKRGNALPKTRYYLLSKAFSPMAFLELIQSHWTIETSLHWTLDVHLGEDQYRGRKDNSAANIATLNRFARNLLQMADKPNVPISHRITKCTFSDAYLKETLAHMR